jgi:hypothetical protein
MLNVLQDPCHYSYLREDIHAFSFKSPSQAAVNQFVHYLDDLRVNDSPHTIRLLLDWSESGLLPLTYTFQQARKFLAQHLNWRTTRIAILYGANFPIVMAETFFRMVRFSISYEVKFFPVEARSQALDWLLQEE